MKNESSKSRPPVVARHGGRCAQAGSPIFDLRSSIRPAFTIVELIVSIGILSIMMGIAGAVFSLTLRSSGEATALIEVSQGIRMFQQNLRDDLANIPRGASVLIIQGNKVNAALTPEDAEVDRYPYVPGSGFTDVGNRRDPDHEMLVNRGSGLKPVLAPLRSDVLAFVTSRPETSYVPPRIAGNPRVAGGLQWVTYGHAEFGTIQASSAAKLIKADPQQFTTIGANVTSPTVFEQDQLAYDPATGSYYAVPANPAAVTMRKSPLPARDWAMARRSVIIVDQTLDSSRYFYALNMYDSPLNTSQTGKDPAYPGSIDAENWLVDGRVDVLIHQLNKTADDGNGDGLNDGFKYTRDVVKRAQDLNRGGEWNYALATVQPPEYDNGDPEDTATWKYYPMPMSYWTRRSLIDPAPPADQAERLGHMLLAHCASFKVEWAFELTPEVIAGFDEAMKTSGDPGMRELLWIDPGDFANQIDALERRSLVAFPTTIVPASRPFPPDSRYVWYFDVRDKLLPRDPTGVATPAAIDDPNDANRLVWRFLSAGSSFAGPWTPLRSHIFYSTRPYPAGCKDLLATPAVSECVPVAEPDPLFPKALRITLDVFDSSHRLSRPIRHVMILPVGQG